MAITQLGLHGPQAAYGTFAAKAEDGRTVPLMTRYGLTGPMTAYATFAAKAPSSGSGAFWVFGDTVIE